MLRLLSSLCVEGSSCIVYLVELRTVELKTVELKTVGLKPCRVKASLVNFASIEWHFLIRCGILVLA